MEMRHTRVTWKQSPVSSLASWKETGTSEERPEWSVDRKIIGRNASEGIEPRQLKSVGAETVYYEVKQALSEKVVQLASVQAIAEKRPAPIAARNDQTEIFRMEPLC